jgi:hypothetical protein
MACFSDLPIELVRLIASNTSYESIGALSCADRRSWIACQDWTVLKGLLRETHHEAYRYVLKTHGANDVVWKKFALAASKAAVADVGAPEFLSWAPQLFALHRESNLPAATEIF